MDFQDLNMRRPQPAYPGAHPRREWLVSGLLLALLVSLIHGHNLAGAWRWDDGVHLSFAATFTPFQYFLDPDITRLQSGANLTPWNALFYDINLSLFGMDAAAHYAHMLLILWLTACFFYLVLRYWLPPVAAFTGAAAFILGIPTLHVAAGLMHGHYATGLLLSLLAILGWIRHFERGGRIWLPLSVVAYLLAVTCKEVYVPLVLVLPFLPVASLRQRIRPWLPYIGVAMAYTAWRYLVLGRLLGGYAQGSFSYDNALRQFLNIPSLLLGGGITGLLFAALLSLLLPIAAWRRQLAWPLVLVLAAVTLLPLIPLTAFPGINQADRYLFMPWVALSALFAALLPRAANGSQTAFRFIRRQRGFFTRALAVAPFAFLLSLLLTHWQGRAAIRPDLDYWDRLSRFVLTADTRRQALFIGADDGYKRLVLSETRRTADRIASVADSQRLLIIDQIGTNLLQAGAGNVQIFEMLDGTIQPMTPARLAAVFPHGMHFAAGQPLTLELRLRDKTLHWKFTPADGVYYVSPKNHPVLQTADIGSYLPAQGQLPWPNAKEVRLSFCRIVPEAGRIACSPVLDFDFSTRESHVWSGIGQYDAPQ